MAIPNDGYEAECITNGTQIELVSPFAKLVLDMSDGLRATRLENRLTGMQFDLGLGEELAVDLDAAERRLFITGWRGTACIAGGPGPDQEEGLQRGYHQPRYDDGAWSAMVTPANQRHISNGQATGYSWARTHLFLPTDCRGKDMTLVLGGLGLFDFRYMRVFVNGFEVGVRRALRRWNEPGRFDIGPASAIHRHLRFGQDNVIALQLSGHITRNARLEECDPLHVRQQLPWGRHWPAQFEQYLVVGGLPVTPRLTVRDVRADAGDAGSQVAVILESVDQGLAATVTYRWDIEAPVLRKSATIMNTGTQPCMLLNVHLGQYRTGQEVTEGEQGFPVYVAGELFLSLAHPAGWAMGENGQICLRQYPGLWLEPGERITTMEAVLGVARAGEARPSFLQHVKSRMRRLRNGHDRPYSIMTGFGSWPLANQDDHQAFLSVTEEYVLDHLGKLAQVQREAGCPIDYDEIEFWIDTKGDLTYPDTARFPHGFMPITDVAGSLGISLGLWINSARAGWTIGQNPVVSPSLSYDPAYGSDTVTLCRATDPYHTMFTSAFLHHLRENNVGLIKFDDLFANCYNPTHPHLPGVYSTEAIQNAQIETLRRLDEARPEVLLFLYWGHRSPWWLLHADTLFEPGFYVEAAHPGGFPTLYVRDSVIQGLDQAQWYCEDVPALGKDSLGVWLSSWRWNSSIGKERWQEAFVMDLCRGSLLGQIWADWDFLSPPERDQLALFMNLLKANPAAFGNPRFILGNPWHKGPYGYCCSDGERAFIALNNCTWSDQHLTFQLNGCWGLPDDLEWHVYRWYPNPAQLEGRWRGGEGGPTIALRPFEIVLFEAVRSADEPSLRRAFMPEAVPASVAEPSRAVSLEVQTVENSGTTQQLLVAGVAPASANGGVLFVGGELRKDDLAYPVTDVGSCFSVTGALGGVPMVSLPVVGERTYPVSWQGWRIAVPASGQEQAFRLEISAQLGSDVNIVCQGHFIPSARHYLVERERIG